MSRARDFADLAGSADAGGLTGRNMIINGSMAVFQRATSATTMTNAYGAVDRFKGFSNGGGAFTGEKYDMTASEIATTGQYQALKMLVSTADTSIAAAEYYALQYKFEGDDLQHLKYGSSSAESFTVSFWVKSDTTGTYFLTVDKIANGLTAYRLPIEYTISSADTWEKKEITVSPTAGSTSLITSSAGAIGGGTGHGLSLYWGFAWGTDYHGTNNTWSTGNYGTNATANGWMGTVGNDFYITGVQVEVGEQATPFEHRSAHEEYMRCLRYCYRIESNAAYTAFAVTRNWSTTNAGCPFPMPVPMRVSPTLTTTSISGNFDYSVSAISVAGSQPAAGASGMGVQVVNLDLVGSFTNGGAAQLAAANTTNEVFVQFDAEL